jgi:hypothetical protein
MHDCKLCNPVPAHEIHQSIESLRALAIGMTSFITCGLFFWGGSRLRGHSLNTSPSGVASTCSFCISGYVIALSVLDQRIQQPLQQVVIGLTLQQLAIPFLDSPRLATVAHSRLVGCHPNFVQSCVQ